MTEMIGVIVAVVGCFVGLAGWLSGRDKRIVSDAEWRGTINAKLDLIVGLGRDVESLRVVQQQHGERLTSVEASAKQAHLRITEHISARGE